MTKIENDRTHLFEMECDGGDFFRVEPSYNGSVWVFQGRPTEEHRLAYVSPEEATKVAIALLQAAEEARRREAAFWERQRGA